MTRVFDETRSAIQTRPGAGARYTGMAQALHWLTSALIFIVLSLAWVMFNMPKDAPWRGTLYTMHKSVGVTIFALVILRLIWRAAHHAPPLNRLPGWMRVSAFASHWLLYLVLLLMPMSGYVMSAALGKPISFFNLFDLPGFAEKNEPAMKGAHFAHVGVLQWGLYALLLLHIGAAVWHAGVRRDGVIDRMLPPQEEL